MRIRRTIYWKYGEPITLAYVSGVDGHPGLDGPIKNGK